MFAIHVRPQDSLKAAYADNLRRAFLIGALIHLMIFVFTPPFQFQPYKLETQEEFVVMDLEPEIIIPKPPPEPPMPDVTKTDDDAAAEDVLFPENVVDDLDEAPVSTWTAPERGRYIVFDSLPELSRFVMPIYPALAREAGIEGTVQVSVLVSAEGKVLETAVVGSDVTPAMERAALEAARRCRFKPATQQGVPVPARVVIPFGFVLD